jgi:hypothetical protein
MRTKQFDEPSNKLIQAYNQVVADLSAAKNKMFKGFENELRSLCFGVCRVFVALLLQLHAMENPRTKNIEVFARWVNIRDLYSPRHTDVMRIVI